MKFNKKLFLNYLFFILLVVLSISGFVSADFLDPGGGGGSNDTTPPCIYINSPTQEILENDETETVTIDVSATDDTCVNKIKLYIDNFHVTTAYGSSCTYIWHISDYDDASGHSIRAVAYDGYGNTKTKITSHYINYKEDIEHYFCNNGYGEQKDDFDDRMVGWSRIELNDAIFTMQIRIQSINVRDDYTRASFFDVITMYTYTGERKGYDLGDEAPLYGPAGTLKELNFEMEEINSDLKDHVLGKVFDERNDDRAFYPEFQTPDKASASDTLQTAISDMVTIVTSAFDISNIGGFTIGKITDCFINKINIGKEDPFSTGYEDASSVEIKYLNTWPNDQRPIYPDSDDDNTSPDENYAYDAISRHKIKLRYTYDSSLVGETIGLKIRFNGIYKARQIDDTPTITSNWITYKIHLDD
ncbi:MAG: Ig-like domain-containing protein [Asgard group archaeon]|nr:Ig-like domain-containing protein [Asgard group archaeon]